MTTIKDYPQSTQKCVRETFGLNEEDIILKYRLVINEMWLVGMIDDSDYDYLSKYVGDDRTL